uniref:Single domain-containing protein n=1 Tax=Magallana gigas TaxID=29159 RepID=A0A8W8HTC2_MAGGI
MERLTLFVSIFCVLFVYAEAFCWPEGRGNGYYCKYKNKHLRKGESYFNATGPFCLNCTCSEDAYTLNCCSIGINIFILPNDCERKQVGCNQEAVSKADPSKPCCRPFKEKFSPGLNRKSGGKS